MTTGLRTAQLGFAIAIALAIGAGNAQATNPCIADAKQTFTECKGDCKESFQVAKDNCINRDHECVEGCRAGRSECVDATNLDEDLAVCRNNLRDAKEQCRATHAEGSPELDACIDAAQVVAFLCRKQARRDAKPLITACRAGFRACVQACPPPDPPSEVVDTRQCKLDAKAAYLVCKADCREGFQTQKDLCLNRDHECVEGCRAGRDACRQPVEDQLDADIAQCNATRDSTIAGCNGDATCILNAQIAAFQCRDQAREDAKPSFQACRAGFVACAQACPPAS
jgi:hypothetical protein